MSSGARQGATVATGVGRLDVLGIRVYIVESTRSGDAGAGHIRSRTSTGIMVSYAWAGGLAKNASGDRSRRNRVDSDALFAQFDRGTARQMNGGSLCHRVIEPAQPGAHPADARYRDDASRSTAPPLSARRVSSRQECRGRERRSPRRTGRGRPRQRRPIANPSRHC